VVLWGNDQRQAQAAVTTAPEASATAVRYDWPSGGAQSRGQIQ
jgi:hypothetical protein